MLTRFAACFLSLGLLGSAAAAHEQPAPVASMVQIEVNRSAVRAALEKRRAKNLKAFRAYLNRGVYPRNTVRVGPLNVWIDRYGHLCAAATMIDKDGKHDLVEDVAKRDLFLRLMNVTEGPLLDWILTSGFTIEEIDRIQAPMVGDYDDLLGNRPVRISETERLRADYTRTDAWLVKRAKAALDLATDRLMHDPALARRLVDGTL